MLKRRTADEIADELIASLPYLKGRKVRNSHRAWVRLLVRHGRADGDWNAERFARHLLMALCFVDAVEDAEHATLDKAFALAEAAMPAAVRQRDALRLALAWLFECGRAEHRGGSSLNTFSSSKIDFATVRLGPTREGKACAEQAALAFPETDYRAPVYDIPPNIFDVLNR